MTKKEHKRKSDHVSNKYILRPPHFAHAVVSSKGFSWGGGTLSGFTRHSRIGNGHVADSKDQDESDTARAS